MEIKLLLSDHVDEIFNFEMNRLVEKSSRFEAEMASWDSPWRKESLQHYAQLGWGFVAIQEDQICGYILGQPLLYFNQWTQSLWIEHVAFENWDQGKELIDISVKWARTKHLQKVLFNQQISAFTLISQEYKTLVSGGYLHLSTTRMQEETP